MVTKSSVCFGSFTGVVDTLYLLRYLSGINYQQCNNLVPRLSEGAGRGPPLESLAARLLVTFGNEACIIVLIFVSRSFSCSLSSILTWPAAALRTVLHIFSFQCLVQPDINEDESTVMRITCMCGASGVPLPIARWLAMDTKNLDEQETSNSTATSTFICVYMRARTHLLARTKHHC